MKKIIFGIISVVIITGGIFLYKNYKEDQKLIASLSELTPYRKDNVNKDTQDIVSNVEKVQGAPVSESTKKDIQKNVIEVDAIGADVGIKSTIEQVFPLSYLYFSYNNENYGTSKTSNLCSGGENNISDYLKGVMKYSKTSAICTVSTTFPAKSFTVTAASVTKSGFYCTDQNGFQGLIDSNSNQFKIGIQCK